MKYPASKKRSGFTLIELLIAVSLFSIAVAVSVGGFVHALRTQRQLIALISANSSASLAIEQMARAIRTGYSFKPCTEVGGICSELTFTSATGDRVTYLKQDDTLMIRMNDSPDPQSLLPADAEIRYLNFTLLANPSYPPRITVNMGVTAKSYGLEGSVTNLQTTVSSRNF
jgi:prepilin-type N-terminal cleavage/methylation domain-containing protein